MDREIQQLLDRAAIIDTVTSYATGVDRRDWELYASIFTDPFEADFSSWSGRPPGSMAVADWVEAVRSGLSGFDATQHQSTNHVVTFHEPDEARCISEIQAQHVIDGDWCILGGHYTNSLRRTDVGWKISRCELTVRYRTGDPDVFARASQRWRQRQVP